MSTRLTKAQLLAKIDQLESELGLARQTEAEMQREIDALYVQQRPSRSTYVGDWKETIQVPVVMLGGKPHTKHKAWEHGRLVTTYRPLHSH